MSEKRVPLPWLSLPLMLLLVITACEQPNTPPTTTTTVAATTTTTIGTKPAGPTVTVSSTAGAATNVSPIPITITFGDAVSGFELADITVGNGSAAGLATADNKTFTASLTPTAEGAVTVDIAADKSTSVASGAGNAAAVQFIVAYDVTKPVIPAILSPAPGANTGKNLKPTVTWTALPDCTYDLQISSSQSFPNTTGTVVNVTGLTGTSYTPAADLAVSATAPKGRRYYLRLRAVDAAGNVGDWYGKWNSTPPQPRYVNVGRVDNDFNGDGYADVIAGAPHVDTYSEYPGNAFIFYGGPSMGATYDETTASVTLTGQAAGDQFGYSVSSADVNGDGYADAIVGAPYNDFSGRADCGSAYVYYGGSSMNTNAARIYRGTAAGDLLGFSVAGAGDMNGDGYEEILYGARDYDSGKGMAYIARSTSATGATQMTLDGSGGRFGCSVAGAGDVNGDGYADAIVGAYNSLPSPGIQGNAYIYYGGASMNAGIDLTLTGNEGWRQFGNSTSSAGDMNGDGYADVIVGAHYLNNTNPYPGKACVFYGGSSMDNGIDLTFTGVSNGDQFGYSVACAGDLNGDGYSDAVVGSSNRSSTINDGISNGSVYVYHGGQSPDTLADLTVDGVPIPLGVTKWTGFGKSVAGAGDVNGDGYDDLLAGAIGYGISLISEGRVYLYHGGASMNAEADVTFSGVTDHGYLGTSVASAGDPVSVPRLWCLPFRKREFV